MYAKPVRHQITSNDTSLQCQSPLHDPPNIFHFNNPILASFLNLATLNEQTTVLTLREYKMLQHQRTRGDCQDDTEPQSWRRFLTTSSFTSSSQLVTVWNNWYGSKSTIQETVSCEWRHISPPSQKHAVVTPLQKKPGLDADDLKNYRLVSNLTFTSKLAERPVALRLTSYLNAYGLRPQLQSVYRRHHSTKRHYAKCCRTYMLP